MSPMENKCIGKTHKMSSDALLCYACNSRYDPRCADPFNPYSLGIMNCSMIVPAVPDVKHNICRKMTQKIYGEVRVWRGCGYIADERDDKECVKRSGTHDVQVHYCSCTTDFCNGASVSLPSLLLVAPVLAATGVLGALMRVA
ncbi:uncharacterized protein LOC113376259 [Ctenocephalides felis]|uniref:uncharacterized protein LOC113376259 n=1 Tax=Ctenocephalides felis TaxID=7515 RepID=UPI000E6E40E8|nr:uncharacterized protein LOC113376259 [Ctenocephalides felis]